jgi:hypothetical protein
VAFRRGWAVTASRKHVWPALPRSMSDRFPNDRFLPARGR